MRLLFAVALALSCAAQTVAPEAAVLNKVWHLGRVTGDLERIIAFYHDLLGLDLRGNRSPIPFYTVPAITEFVDAPAGAEFRAAFLPIPGANSETKPADQVYLEAFEFRDIERHQAMPTLATPGASMLRFIVRDLSKVLTAAKAAGVSYVTKDGVPVSVSTPTGAARSLILRDPDGYPVELVELTPTPASFAPSSANILGAQTSLVVADLAQSIHTYSRLMGLASEAAPGPWHRDTAWTQSRRLPDLEFRTATIALPGTTLALELVEYRAAPAAPPYRPAFQDIGHGHIAFLTKDIEVVTARMKELGLKPLARGGAWTAISPTLRAVYTRDRDGFFLEIIERK